MIVINLMFLNKFQHTVQILNTYIGSFDKNSPLLRKWPQLFERKKLWRVGGLEGYLICYLLQDVNKY